LQLTFWVGDPLSDRSEAADGKGGVQFEDGESIESFEPPPEKAPADSKEATPADGKAPSALRRKGRKKS